MATCNKCERKPLTPNENCPVYNMDDGRHFTDYRPRCAQNNSMLNNNVMNSYEYRMYLQKNAKNLMSQNKKIAQNNNKCEPCFDFSAEGTMLPEAYQFQCNAKTCNLNENASYGIGTGRNYNVGTVKEGFSSCNRQRESFMHCDQKPVSKETYLSL